MIEVVSITDEDLSKARDFALRKQRTSFPRLGEDRDEQLARLYIGKIGEIAGDRGLTQRGIQHECPEMFQVVERQSYGDISDCVIFSEARKNFSADFKAAWRAYHERILIPQDQYQFQPKDLYLGVRMKLKNENSVAIFPEFNQLAEVFGWATKFELNQPDERSSRFFPAYWKFLKDLHDLNGLRKL